MTRGEWIGVILAAGALALSPFLWLIWRDYHPVRPEYKPRPIVVNVHR